MEIGPASFVDVTRSLASRKPVDVILGFLFVFEGCEERLLLLPNDLRSSSCKEVGAFFAGDFFLLTSRVIVFVCTEATR